MCHSALVVRHLLTKPGAPLVVRASRCASRRTSRASSGRAPRMRKQLAKTMGRDVDYAKTPAEDFASMTIEFETDDGYTVIGEASTSWSFVGAGLRLSAELLGPSIRCRGTRSTAGSSCSSPARCKGKAGEDLVEKQNAEMGLMPVVANEPMAYGYEAEDRHFVRVLPRQGRAVADVRRRRRGCEDAHDRVSERGAGEDVRAFRRKGWTSSCRQWRAAIGLRRACRGKLSSSEATDYTECTELHGKQEEIHAHNDRDSLEAFRGPPRADDNPW